jgi:hypothetical protein
MRLRTIIFVGFIGAMIGLGLFVNSIFLLLGMSGLCGGHMLLHGKEHNHDSVAVKDDEKARTGCH